MIVLCTPTAGHCSTEFVSGLAELLTAAPRRGIEIKPAISTNGPALDIARNTHAAIFMASAATHLLFIDSDIAFAAADVFRLIEADRMIVGAPYQMKLPGSIFAVEELPGARADRNGFIPVAGLGTGFMLIAREAFLAIGAADDLDRSPPRQLPSALKPSYAGYFDLAKGPTGEALTEDYAFCQRAREAGLAVWADTQAKIAHIGPRAYAGRWEPTPEPDRKGEPIAS